MANKNVILKDESANNIYPFTKIGNILNNDGTQVNVATEGDIDTLQNQIDALSSPIAETHGTFNTEEKWIATRNGDLPTVSLISVPFSNIYQILKLIITVVATEDIDDPQERVITMDITPGYSGDNNVSLCWPYDDDGAGIGSAIFNFQFATKIEGGVLKTEIYRYSYESVSAGDEISMWIKHYSLVYYKD